MFAKLILLFILVPLADLLLLMTLSAYTGLRFSIAMVILSGIVGAWLAKRSYKSVWNKIQTNVANQQMSPGLLTDGAMIFFAAGLLLTPGFITDAVGFSLLIPPCRRWYKSRITHWAKRNLKFQVVTFGDNNEQDLPMGNAGAGEEGVVDGQVLHPESAPPKRLSP